MCVIIRARGKIATLTRTHAGVVFAWAPQIDQTIHQVDSRPKDILRFLVDLLCSSTIDWATSCRILLGRQIRRQYNTVLQQFNWIGIKQYYLRRNQYLIYRRTLSLSIGLALSYRLELSHPAERNLFDFGSTWSRDGAILFFLLPKYASIDSMFQHS